MSKQKLGYWPVPGKAHTYYFGYGSDEVTATGEGELVPEKSEPVHFASAEYAELGAGDA